MSPARVAARMRAGTGRAAGRCLAAGLALALLVTGCSGSAAPSPPSSPSPPAAGSPSPTPAGPTGALTGQPLPDPGAVRRPVLAVKVENSPAARPQSGLEAADIVFEEVVEGGATRFIALFHSRAPKEIGPVRSARLVDAEVLPAFTPLFAFSGGRPDVLSALRRADLPLIVEGAPAYRRVDFRPSPHNLYASAPSMWDLEAAEDQPPARPAFRYSEDPPPGAVGCPTPPATTASPPEGEAPGSTGGAPGAAAPTGGATSPAPGGAPDTALPAGCDPRGEELDVAMSGASVTGWRYDTGAGVYRRLQNGAPFEVAGDGRIGAANVVVLGMRIHPGACCDTAGSRLMTTEAVGSGPAVLLRDGRLYRGQWRKDSARDHYALLTGGGRPLLLEPGATWILLAPRSGLPDLPDPAG